MPRRFDRQTRLQGIPAIIGVSRHRRDIVRKLALQCEVRVAFVARLRDEERFPSIDALIAQIQRDIQSVREAARTQRNSDDHV